MKGGRCQWVALTAASAGATGNSTCFLMVFEASFDQVLSITV